MSTVKNWLDGELIYVKNVRPSVVNMNNEVNKVKRAEYMIPYSKQDHQAELSFGQTKLILFCTASDEKGFQKLEPGHLSLSQQAKGQTCIALQP